MVKKLTKTECEKYRALLQNILGVLNGDIDRLEHEALDEPTTAAEGGSDAYAQEFSLELLERDESTQREVLDALARIEDGTYGLCEGCETPIRRERLKTVPYARNCVECQRAQEDGLPR